MSFLNKFKPNKNNKNQQGSGSKKKKFSLKHWLNSSVDTGEEASNIGAQEEQEAEDKENRDPVANYLRIEMQGLKRSLKFPASWLTTNNELKMYAQMKASTKKVNTSGLAIFIAMIAAFIIPLMLPVIGSIGTRLGAGIVFMVAVWFFNYFSIKAKYSNYSFKNQLRFNTLLTILDLSELKRGYSVNALLAKTAQRFESKDKILSDAISTLNSRIQDKPSSPEPYLVFAREFSTTQRARLYMMAIYRMAQGNYDDSEIKSLKRSSAKELSYQSAKLANKKVGKFNKLQLMEFIGFILYLVTYILFFIGLHVMQLMKGAM